MINGETKPFRPMPYYGIMRKMTKLLRKQIALGTMLQGSVRNTYQLRKMATLLMKLRTL